MARIEHLALWTRDIGRLTDFYVRFFGARPGAPYRNPGRAFESRFLEFDGGARLEIMRTGRLELAETAPGAQRLGLTHLAISVGSEAQVDALTREIAALDSAYERIAAPTEQQKAEHYLARVQLKGRLASALAKRDGLA